MMPLPGDTTFDYGDRFFFFLLTPSSMGGGGQRKWTGGCG